jgi:hypothetical protein
MHRIQAGTLDESGWTNANSTQGVFTATMPCLFNDFTVEDMNAKSSTEKVFTLGCRRYDQRKFSVSRVQYRSGNADAQTFFEGNAIVSEWPRGTVVRSKFQGFAIIDVELDESGLRR